MIKIDGSFGEGGGQILRTAISLSCITLKPVEVYNIRANRPKPGLAAQHLKGIESAKIISDAEVEGLRLGSTKVVFKPRNLKGGSFKVDIETAGSVTLILQTVLLPSLIAEKTTFFEIKGGTDVKWSPPVDYLKNVTFKALEKLNVDVKLEVVKRGYYPKGGGLVKVEVNSSKLRGFKYSVIKEDIKGISHCLNLPKHIVNRQAKAAIDFLKSKGYKAEIKTEVGKGFSTGSGITLWSGYKGGSSLGERGKRAEIVGKEAVNEIAKELESNACFDKHLADQIMPFSAVAKGNTIYTTSEITKHLISNAYVIEKFLGDVVELDEEKKEVKIKGVGLV
ncbi:RNA 3'-phosphate cyclase [Archaeoglobales archaeon]|nr:MAG: RNA 3'-phosphate cyclase [Archaeoglobales archaeon]